MEGEAQELDAMIRATSSELSELQEQCRSLEERVLVRGGGRQTPRKIDLSCWRSRSMNCGGCVMEAETLSQDVQVHLSGSSF